MMRGLIARVQARRWLKRELLGLLAVALICAASLAAYVADPDGNVIALADAGHEE